ncbi:matrix metalloproteinase, partial [Trifolium medium]|nr:matrix metalloproteinase [Trifolium medium]
MKLQNDGDVRTMFSIFSRYMTRGPIELDAKLVRSVAICSNLILPSTFDEIATCMVKPEHDEIE